MEVRGQLHIPVTLYLVRDSRNPLNRKLVGLLSRSGRLKEEINILPLSRVEPRFLGRTYKEYTSYSFAYFLDCDLCLFRNAKLQKVVLLSSKFLPAHLKGFCNCAAVHKFSFWRIVFVDIFLSLLLWSNKRHFARRPLYLLEQNFRTQLVHKNQRYFMFTALINLKFMKKIEQKDVKAPELLW